jgi:hypothetical protein
MATIAIIGISPPRGVGAFIICIIMPKKTPPIRPAMIPLPISERMVILLSVIFLVITGNGANSSRKMSGFGIVSRKNPGN